MKLTNKFALPAPVVRALSFDNYSKGEARFSATELIDSPRVRQLQWLHKHDIEQDVVDNFFSLLGRAVHTLMENGATAPGETPEERLFLKLDVDGIPVTISGSMDLQSGRYSNHGMEQGWVDISDYKVTTVYSYKAGKIDWERQLNIYKHMVEKLKGERVRKLKIIVFMRDWQSSKAGQNGYPLSPIQVVNIPMWSAEECERYILERVRLHLAAADAVMAGDEPVMCTSEEMWRSETTFAVMKKDGKRALKVYDTEAEAQKHIDEAHNGASVKPKD